MSTPRAQPSGVIQPSPAASISKDVEGKAPPVEDAEKDAVQGIESTTYPSSWKLACILIALALVIFMFGLDM
jgi:hypothetical protein